MLQELRKRRAELVAAARQIVGPPSEPRTLSADEAERVHQLLSEAEAIRARLERGDDLRAAVEAVERDLVPESQIPAPARTRRDGDGGIRVARLVRALAAARNDPIRAAAWARQTLGDQVVAKVLEASTGSAGGFLVPDQLAADVIELLGPESAVRRLEPVVLSMPSGTLRLPGIASGASAGYVGEAEQVQVSEPTFRQVVLTWKKLSALVPVSNDLLRFASPRADEMVRDDLVAALARASDQKFIRGVGSQNEPKGLRYWAPAAHVFTANATVNLANVTSDLGKLVLALEQGNSRMRRPGWIMAPRTKEYLATVRDANGNFPFREEIMRGQLWGFRLAVTTNVPTNLGAGSDESEIYLADFADVIVGEASTLLLDASAEGAYVSAGTVYSAFERDITLVRALVHHDLAVRHPESVAVLTAVKWTP